MSAGVCIHYCSARDAVCLQQQEGTLSGGRACPSLGICWTHPRFIPAVVRALRVALLLSPSWFGVKVDLAFRPVLGPWHDVLLLVLPTNAWQRVWGVSTLLDVAMNECCMLFDVAVAECCMAYYL